MLFVINLICRNIHSSIYTVYIALQSESMEDTIDFNGVKINFHWARGFNLWISPEHHSLLSMKCVISNIDSLEKHVSAYNFIFNFFYQNSNNLYKKKYDYRGRISINKDIFL